MIEKDAIEILKSIQENLEETRFLERCAIDMAIEALKERPHGVELKEVLAYECGKNARPHGECKTCKHYIPYREQFSYRHRGDGYCKRTVTTSEGQAFINCHDEWYCANYEKGGESE